MIIITTYHEKLNDDRFKNRRKYLQETIDSIDKQKVDNLFHIIVDDGSDKEVYDYIFRKYNIPGKRLILRREKKIDEPLTSTNARNFALDFCIENMDENDYLSFIDSDDLLINLKERFNFAKKENSDFAYTDSLLFFDKTDIFYKWGGMNPVKAYRYFWISGSMPYPTMIWKICFIKKLKSYVKELYNIDGPFDPKIGCGEDVDVALSSFECANKNNLKISYLPEITAAYRIHNASLAVIRNQDKRAKEEKSVIERHFGNLGSRYLYIKRFFVRPECYIPVLMKVKNIFRKKFSKKNFPEFLN